MAKTRPAADDPGFDDVPADGSEAPAAPPPAAPETPTPTPPPPVATDDGFERSVESGRKELVKAFRPKVDKLLAKIAEADTRRDEWRHILRCGTDGAMAELEAAATPEEFDIRLRDLAHHTELQRDHALAAAAARVVAARCREIVAPVADAAEALAAEMAGEIQRRVEAAEAAERKFLEGSGAPWAATPASARWKALGDLLAIPRDEVSRGRGDRHGSRFESLVRFLTKQ